MTRMRHPVHGFTNTEGGVTVADLKRHGWVEDIPEVVAKRENGENGKHGENGKVDDEAKLKEEYFQTFGKKPHHMMATKTIKQALNDYRS